MIPGLYSTHNYYRYYATATSLCFTAFDSLSLFYLDFCKLLLYLSMTLVTHPRHFVASCWSCFRHIMKNFRAAVAFCCVGSLFSFKLNLSELLTSSSRVWHIERFGPQPDGQRRSDAPLSASLTFRCLVFLLCSLTNGFLLAHLWFRPLADLCCYLENILARICGRRGLWLELLIQMFAPSSLASCVLHHSSCLHFLQSTRLL